MLEYAKVDRFLMRLDAPRDGIVGVDVDPTYKIRLRVELVDTRGCGQVSYLAVNLQLLHRCHCAVKGCKSEWERVSACRFPSRSGAAEGGGRCATDQARIGDFVEGF